MRESDELSAEFKTALLAGKILPIIFDDPRQAFPAGIARKLRGNSNTTRTSTYDEGRVGAAMHFLEGENLLSVREREAGEDGRVKFYSITKRGMFWLSLISSVQAKK